LQLGQNYVNFPQKICAIYGKEAENMFGSEEYDCGIALFIGEVKREFEKKKGEVFVGFKGFL